MLLILFFENFVDPDTDTEFGVFVASEFEIIRAMVTDIMETRPNILFKKKGGGDISCIRRIYWLKGFSVKEPPSELSMIKVSLIF